MKKQTNNETKKTRKKHEKLTFASLGIKPGEKIYFHKDHKIEVTVKDDLNQVSYGKAPGLVYSGDIKNIAYQIAKKYNIETKHIETNGGFYEFFYNGKRLPVLRNELITEKEHNEIKTEIENNIIINQSTHESNKSKTETIKKEINETIIERQTIRIENLELENQALKADNYNINKELKQMQKEMLLEQKEMLLEQNEIIELKKLVNALIFKFNETKNLETRLNEKLINNYAELSEGINAIIEINEENTKQLEGEIVTFQSNIALDIENLNNETETKISNLDNVVEKDFRGLVSQFNQITNEIYDEIKGNENGVNAKIKYIKEDFEEFTDEVKGFKDEIIESITENIDEFLERLKDENATIIKDEIESSLSTLNSEVQDNRRKNENNFSSIKDDVNNVKNGIATVQNDVATLRTNISPFVAFTNQLTQNIKNEINNEKSAESNQDDTANIK